jgi:hypothetical protein
MLSSLLIRFTESFETKSFFTADLLSDAEQLQGLRVNGARLA